MKNCIFCKIVRDEIPCVKLHSDDLATVFMDIAPVNPGHLLVIPNEHHNSASTIPEAVAGRIFALGSLFGLAAKKALDMDGFNLHLADGACAGQVVMHAHLHMIPRHPEDGFHWNWRQKPYSEESERDEIARKILEKARKRL